MGQVSFKLPEKEMEFLRWYSKQKASSMSVMYKEATLDHFKKWKLQILVETYARGTIGFKQLCKLGNISFQEGMLLIDEVEPPISKIVDEYTDMVREKLEKELRGIG